MALPERDIVGIVFSVLVFIVVGAYCCHIVLKGDDRKVVLRRSVPVEMQDNTTQSDEQQRDVERGAGEGEEGKEGESWIKKWIRR
jgi:hypothetical protein